MQTFNRIKELKKSRNSVILAHYYQPPEIQDIADLVGDSFELSKRARDTEADVILFCGVYFMGESAKILSPGKTVLMPALGAGCPMADMVTPAHIHQLKKEHPDAVVMTYINSSADVKAASDICCTSSNAVRLAKALPNDEIIFVPDRNLGAYIAKAVPEKKFILFSGYCPVHNDITVDDVALARSKYPGLPLLVHPECPVPVSDAADFVGSTSQILEHAHASEQKEFVIGTESGILHMLKKQNPDKTFHMLTQDFICPDMKKATLDDVLTALEHMRYRVELNNETIEKALSSLNRMLST